MSIFIYVSEIPRVHKVAVSEHSSSSEGSHNSSVKDCSGSRLKQGVRRAFSERKKAPHSIEQGALKSGNLATTYSPGPVGQVPSAPRGLTAVFGMGTGVAL